MIEVEDGLSIRLRLDSVASVGAIRFHHGNILYRTKVAREETSGLFPVEG